MADYVLSAAAESDLRAIIRYTREHYGLEQARIYPAQLKQAAETAAMFPTIGRAYTTKTGIVFQQYNVARHALFYQVSDDGNLIVRILHMMMDFDSHLA